MHLFTEQQCHADWGYSERTPWQPVQLRFGAGDGITITGSLFQGTLLAFTEVLPSGAFQLSLAVLLERGVEYSLSSSQMPPSLLLCAVWAFMLHPSLNKNWPGSGWVNHYISIDMPLRRINPSQSSLQTEKHKARAAE